MEFLLKEDGDKVLKEDSSGILLESSPREVSLLTGSFTLSGNAVSLKRGFYISPLFGEYTYSGISVILRFG